LIKLIWKHGENPTSSKDRKTLKDIDTRSVFSMSSPDVIVSPTKHPSTMIDELFIRPHHLETIGSSQRSKKLINRPVKTDLRVADNEMSEVGDVESDEEIVFADMIKR
jgi:hypothetical protein